MFKKSQRLTKQAFDQSFRRGKRRHTPLLQVIVDATEADFHGAVVVGKKISNKAVVRNRLRRRLYGVLYRHHQQSPLRGTWIVIVKPAAKTVSFDAIRTDLLTLLEGTTTGR